MKSKFFKKFTGFAKHIRILHRLNRRSVGILGWPLRFKDPLRNIVLISILKMVLENAFSFWNLVMQIKWTSVILRSGFCIRRVPFPQTRPEVCCNLQNFAALIRGKKRATYSEASAAPSDFPAVLEFHRYPWRVSCWRPWVVHRSCDWGREFLGPPAPCRSWFDLKHKDWL